MELLTEFQSLPANSKTQMSIIRFLNCEFFLFSHYFGYKELRHHDDSDSGMMTLMWFSIYSDPCLDRITCRQLNQDEKETAYCQKQTILPFYFPQFKKNHHYSVMDFFKVKNIIRTE